MRLNTLFITILLLFITILVRELRIYIIENIPFKKEGVKFDRKSLIGTSGTEMQEFSQDFQPSQKK